jgi:alkanesulfonate monooxygenase SsuD/methylene tetrahydromethanopterin reductase-like flavin-dependent oxidoreductase (luciferase family)
LEFGVVVSSSWSVRDIVASAMAADESGLDFLLVTDHYMSSRSTESVDAWTMLAGLAIKTQRIRLGTCVTPIPFRPPQILAKVVATVDQLSNGRAILGVGAGWHKPEFDAYSKWDDDKVRVAKTREGLELMMKLWVSRDVFDFKGEYYCVKDAILQPKPVQRPYPPLWFGTTGAYMLRLAGRYADGWVPPVPGVSEDIYRAVMKKLKGLSHERGRGSIKVNFNGTLSELSETIAKFAEMGFDGAILARTPPKETPTIIRQFAQEIIPSYRTT